MQSIDDVFNRFEADGTVFGSISKKDFHKIQRTMPPTETVQVFERLIAPIDDEIVSVSQQSRTLAALRDALLPRLLSGKLSVSATNPTIHEVTI
jgi:type I restriction enzyme S subunit